MDELAIDEYSFSDMLLLREVCCVVSRRSANLAAAGLLYSNVSLSDSYKLKPI